MGRGGTGASDVEEEKEPREEVEVQEEEEEEKGAIGWILRTETPKAGCSRGCVGWVGKGGRDD